jgi:hypothetical protein
MSTPDHRPVGQEIQQNIKINRLARIFHESLAATTHMAVLPGVLVCRTLRRTVQVRKPIPRYRGTSCQVARPSSSRSLRSAQSRKRVPSFVVSRQQLKVPAVPLKRDREPSKCKEVIPFYCSSLANPAASYGECAR